MTRAALLGTTILAAALTLRAALLSSRVDLVGNLQHERSRPCDQTDGSGTEQHSNGTSASCRIHRKFPPN
jgi:hypothetical protein